MTIAFDRSMRSKDADGRLHIKKTVLSVANVCPYKGRELTDWEALGLDPDKIYQMYRPAAELARAAPLYENQPLMLRHVAVSAEAPAKDSIIGTVSDISFEDPNLYGSLAVWDQSGIDAIESGRLAQISAGYYFKTVMQPGRAPDGTRFDGSLTELIPNHVAIVETGRVGPESTIADSFPEDFMKTHPKLVNVITPYLAAGADRAALALALDAALEGEHDPELRRRQDIEAAEDMEAGFYGHTKDEWQALSTEDRKAARDEWKRLKELKANDRRRAKDSDPDHRKDFAGGKDSADEIRKQLRAEAQAATVAREAVRSVVGVVTMDSADEIFRFALKHLKVDTKGIHPSALAALFEAHAARRRSAETHRAMANDAWRPEFTVAEIWKGAA